METTRNLQIAVVHLVRVVAAVIAVKDAAQAEALAEVVLHVAKDKKAVAVHVNNVNLANHSAQRVARRQRRLLRELRQECIRNLKVNLRNRAPKVDLVTKANAATTVVRNHQKVLDAISKVARSNNKWWLQNLWARKLRDSLNVFFLKV